MSEKSDKKYSNDELEWIGEFLSGEKKLMVIDPWTNKGFTLDREAKEILIKKYNAKRITELIDQTTKKHEEFNTKLSEMQGIVINNSFIDNDQMDELFRCFNELLVNPGLEAIQKTRHYIADVLKDR